MSETSYLEGKEEESRTSGDACPHIKAFSFKYAKSLWSRRLVGELIPQPVSLGNFRISRCYGVRKGKPGLTVEVRHPWGSDI